jgi:deazaflavin-dependent oxidoreductase (nitroreductase family)
MRSNLRFKAMNLRHRVVLALSGGRWGWTAMDMAVLELTTTGRKSGKPHSVMLTSPRQEGSVLVVVASGGGDLRPPAWFLNLRDNPDVEVRLRTEPGRHMRGRVATPGERERLWPLVIAQHNNYAGYQKMTTREIALALIEPVAEPG